ncbi:39S ribosomal protein L23, mitochondrial isoform X4 [Micropterus dolomieu]|uniref:39S ribosomal protein L23, mitochondrial isoform X4 n=1 Tax=Micropterus dolomieu TaxID=147949 RepID=UPI001E8DB6D6|nr:39S ribosomal protein L23, mitochondrial isoform X4 [Micropterus dolomieu]
MPVTRLLYPLYQLGNPQLRIFRPNWFLTLVRPGKEQPPDTVQFRIPLEMTKCDVKNYLEKIYNVPVGAVRTRIQFGSNKKRNHLNQKVKQPDYKVAYVQLGHSRCWCVSPDSLIASRPFTFTPVFEVSFWSGRAIPCTSCQCLKYVTL